MPHTLVTNEIVMVTLQGTYFGQRTLNTYPYRVFVSAGMPQMNATLNSLIDALLAAGSLVATHQDCRPASSIVTLVTAQVIRPTRFRAIRREVNKEGTFTDNVVGTANVQASIERFGETANRRSVGGVRIPIGTDSDSIDSGFVTAALKEALEDHGDSMALQRTVTNGGDTTIFYPLVGLPTESFAGLDVVGTEAKDTVRVLRRRTVGLGI